MDLLKYTIAVCIGGGLPLLANYILENRRLENERFKFNLNKIVSIGEEYYKFSTYSLIFFTSQIDTIQKREDYMSEGGQYFLNAIDKENKKQIDNINENNLTITTASIYFNVTNPEKAIDHMLLLKEVGLKKHHYSSIGDINNYDNACDEYIRIATSIINQIKADQSTISSKIKENCNIAIFEFCIY
jgi:hypothetical protein